MSSILKALQRLQGDRGAAGSPAPKPALQDQLARDLAAPPLVPPAKAPAEIDPAPSRARLALVAVPVVALLTALAVGGFWLLRRGGDEDAPPVAAAGPAHAAAPSPTAPAPAPHPRRTATAPATPPARAATPAPPPVATAAPPSPSPVATGAPPSPSPIPTAAPPSPPPDAAALAADPDPDPARLRRRVEAPRRPATGEAPRFHVVAETKPADAEPKPEAIETPAPTPRSEDPAQRPGAVPPKPASSRAPAAKPSPPAPTPKKAAAKPARPPAADDGVTVLRTVWHPKPDRRVARLRFPGQDEPVEVHEGDSVRSYVVKTIEPSGVLLEHGGREVRRSVGSGSGGDD